MLPLNRYQYLFFVGSLLCALYLGFAACDSSQAIQLIQHGGYWWMLMTFVLLLGNLFQRVVDFRPLEQERYKEWAWPAVYLLVWSGVLIAMQPSGYKITMDEPVLAATSLQMHLEREVMTASRAYEVNGVFTLLGGYVDKRPYFFPFLTSLLHDFTGYRSQQGVILNYLLTPVFLCLLFWSGRMAWREWGGYLSVALFASVPLLAMNMTGAGFELLNLVMILGTSLAAYSYLERSNALRMNTLILMGLLLAQTRYESVLYVLPVGLVVAIGWARIGRLELSWVAVIAPLLLISFPLQKIIFDNYEGLWQLDHNTKDQPFSVSFISDNLASAGHYFFAMGRQYPNSILLSCLFVAALLGLCYLLVKRRVRIDFQRNEVIVFLVFGAVVVMNFIILMAYHWGQIDDIVATRLVLPFLMLQVLSVVLFLSYFRQRKLWGAACLFVVLAFFMSVTRPLCARSDFLSGSMARDEVNWLRSQVNQFRGQPVLFITNRHLVPIVEQVSALTVRDAIAQKARIDLHQRLGSFSDFLVVYICPFDSGMADEVSELAEDTKWAMALNEAFELETIEEAKLHDLAFIRLARIKQVRLAATQKLELNFDEQSALLDGSAYQAFSKYLP